MTFEGKAAEADLVAEQISRKMKPVGWYTNISTDCDAYVIFTNRVFKYSKGDQEGRAAAQAHARSVGVPEWQLDWSD